MNEQHQHEQPDFIEEMRADLTDWRQWLGRAVVFAFAALAGLAIVVFTHLSEAAFAGFNWLRAWQWWAPLVWTPLVAFLIAWCTQRFAAGASGSGIPQVMASLSSNVEPQRINLFVSLRLAIAKMGLTAAGLLGGLPIGREGPSVQIAAGVMHHARRWLPARFAVNQQGLLVAGGAAGIAAAFNAPLAGVIFAIEELTRRIEHRSSGLIITAIVLAGLVAVAAFGNNTYFGVIRVPPLGWTYLLPALAVIVGCGLLGGVFARLLLVSITGGKDRFSAWRARYPLRFAAGCGLACAVLGVVSGGAAFGSGYDYTRHLVEGNVPSLPLLYVTLRVLATWLAVWSGVPGGIFAPSLAIGAGVGADIAFFSHLDGGAGAPLIAMGMTAFLAAVTQAPLTAFIIVMEMVDGHAMVLTLMAAALGASLLSRWITVPLYAALAQAQLRRLDSSPTS